MTPVPKPTARYPVAARSRRFDLIPPGVSPRGVERTCADPGDVFARVAHMLEAGRPEWQTLAASARIFSLLADAADCRVMRRGAVRPRQVATSRRE